MEEEEEEEEEAEAEAEEEGGGRGGKATRRTGHPESGPEEGLYS